MEFFPFFLIFQLIGLVCAEVLIKPDDAEINYYGRHVYHKDHDKYKTHTEMSGGTVITNKKVTKAVNKRMNIILF